MKVEYGLHTAKWHQAAKWHETKYCSCPITILIGHPHFPRCFKVNASCWSKGINRTTHPISNLPLECTASLLVQLRAFHGELGSIHRDSELNGNAIVCSCIHLSSWKAHLPYGTTGSTTLAQVKIRWFFVTPAQ